MIDRAEFDRWRAAAREALQAADDQAAGDHRHWACFLAEQAAQLAVKGLLHAVGAGPWGHDLAQLAETAEQALDRQLPTPVHEALLRLSRHYIAPRYPDAHPGGTPGDHYSQADVTEAQDDASRVLDWVDDTIAGLTAGEEPT